MKKIFSNKSVIAIVIILIVALLIFIFIGGNNSMSDAMTYEDFTVLKGHLGKLEKYDKSHAIEGYKGGSEAYYIKGKVTSNKDKGFTIMTFNLYDKNDNLLGTAVATLNEVKKGKTYTFKAVSLTEKAKTKQIDHYSIESVK